MKTTLKDIKQLSKQAGITDVTYYSFEELQNLIALEKNFMTIAYSVGAYGRTGLVLQGYKTQSLYTITSRTNAMYVLY